MADYVKEPAVIPADVLKKYRKYHYSQRKAGHFRCDTPTHFNLEKIKPNHFFLIDYPLYGLIWVQYIPQQEWFLGTRHNITDLYLPAYLTSCFTLPLKQEILRVYRRDNPLKHGGRHVHINLGWADHNKMIVRNQTTTYGDEAFLVNYTELRNHLHKFHQMTQDYIWCYDKDKTLNRGYRDYVDSVWKNQKEIIYSRQQKLYLENMMWWNVYLLYCNNYSHQAKVFREISLADMPKIKKHNVVLNDDVWGLIKEFMGLCPYQYKNDPDVKTFNKRELERLCYLSMSQRLKQQQYTLRYEDMTEQELLKYVDLEANSRAMSRDVRLRYIKNVMDWRKPSEPIPNEWYD